MLAHELRNPLAPSASAAAILSRFEVDNTMVRRTSEIIGRQVDHMTALIDDLLDVSRVRRGKVELERLVHVLTNLLGNAAKYTPDGGAVDVALETAGDALSARVSDTGIGMAPDLIANAFELFSQGKRDLDRSQGGLGIGLALVKSLLHLHGGTVSVRSSGPGAGNTADGAGRRLR